ncbi:MAG: 23S rRNA (pseudouridine1915-N3)-methyltransferase [Parvicellaceae bacterium]|jgi:23S rRNA (pseudouridine1915-N3)-methyltransferase
MDIRLILIGKTNSKFLVEGEKEYEKRLKHYVKFTEVIIPELKKASKLSEEQIKTKEGEEVLKKLSKADYLILLDDKGKQQTSKEYSKWIQKRMNSGVKSIVFIVGGAYGFSDEVYVRANEKLSLSKLTFTHQMVRLIFKEQLYRAFTIIKGEKYHHE